MRAWLLCNQATQKKKIGSVCRFRKIRLVPAIPVFFLISHDDCMSELSTQFSISRDALEPPALDTRYLHKRRGFFL